MSAAIGTEAVAVVLAIATCVATSIAAHRVTTAAMAAIDGPRLIRRNATAVQTPHPRPHRKNLKR